MIVSAKYRIMQYNILHEGYASQAYLDIGLENRKNNVVTAIQAAAPDVLFLAERFEEWDAIGEGSVDLMSSLGSDYAIVENTVTYTLAAGGTNTVVNRSPIVYNANTFKVADSGYQFLTEEASTESSGNKRVVTWAILEDITETDSKGYQIAVFGTHWSTNYHWSDKTISFAEYKQAQSDEMRDLINSEKFEGLPIVAGGDFNITYSAAMPEFYPIYESLLNGCKLTDAALSVSDDPTNVVDHIAVSKQFQILNFFFKGAENASDHLPIYCDIRSYRAIQK